MKSRRPAPGIWRDHQLASAALTSSWRLNRIARLQRDGADSILLQVFQSQPMCPLSRLLHCFYGVSSLGKSTTARVSICFPSRFVKHGRICQFMKHRIMYIIQQAQKKSEDVQKVISYGIQHSQPFRRLSQDSRNRDGACHRAEDHKKVPFAFPGRFPRHKLHHQGTSFFHHDRDSLPNAQLRASDFRR